MLIKLHLFHEYTIIESQYTLPKLLNLSLVAEFNSSLPYTGIVPYYLISTFRAIVIGGALLGVLYMLICLARMLKEEKAGLAKAFMPAGKVYVVMIAVLLAAYIAVAFIR